MNQIVCTSSSNIELPSANYKKRKFLKSLFYILIFISFSLSIYYIFYRYDIYRSEKISQKLLNNISITTIYPNNSNYSAEFANKEIILDNKDISGSVIGIIEIKKINIVYPILSEINKEFLKISPCRFYGPLPNEIGNLCIAAHNYKNGTFFSNLENMVNGDIITIYDRLGNNVDYVVYSVYKANAKDTECMNQNTNKSKIITLITCDSFDNSFRTVVKAKEIL